MTDAASESALVLGPLLRYVDDTSATIWVETAEAATVTVRAGERSACARTFSVHGHHYALVELTGLAPGTKTAYTVDVGEQRVWPPAAGEGTRFPPSVIATLEPGKPLRLAFGSCRRQRQPRRGGPPGPRVDALRGYALRMAGQTDRAADRGRALARPGAVPRRPGLRRRDQRGDAGLHRRPPATWRSRRGRSSRTTRSTPTSTGWRGATRRTGGCSRRCRAR